MQKFLFVFFPGILFCFSAIAQVALPDLSTSDWDAGKILTFVVTNWKTLGPVGIGACFVFLFVQIVKTPAFEGLFNGLHPALKRLLLFVFGSLYAVLYAVFGGATWGHAAMVALVSTGTAVAFWEVISPFFKKRT